MERTLVIFKPDTVRRKLMGEILTRIERKNFKISNLKLITISRELGEEHYAHVADRPFFEDMMAYMTSGESLVMIIEGIKVIQVIRKMIGNTKPYEAASGTIRGDFASHDFENMIHASDSYESAETEIKRFFPEIG